MIELFDAVDAMLDAAIKWIMLGSAIASLLLLAAVAVVAWAAKRVRRGLGARLSDEQPSGDSSPAGTADGLSAPPSRLPHEQTGRKAA
ncbi:hypothetical protein AB0I27_22875 [Streptomyces sp. NPDC050597]|uniref:hypothetical protein n=1 Tax=Streptomyces sp. NPDC050597 TaxID=3157212 RepID=UPI0034171BA7